MGTTRKIRKKYVGPSHPWKAERLAEEAILKEEYGLKNKTEIFRAQSVLRRFTGQAKNLIRSRGVAQAQREEQQLLAKLAKLGLVAETTKLDEVLSLTVRNIFDRRLQTLVYQQGFAMTAKQARQFITHGHITINGKKVDAPSLLVTRDNEPLIAFNPISTLTSEDHPERSKERKRKEKVAADRAAADKKRSDEAEELKKLEEIEKVVVVEVAK